MPSLNRHRAGRVAQKIGQTFETILDRLATSKGICCIRIPDGCKPFRGAKGYGLKRVATPFDYVLFYKNRSIILDAKTVEGSTFTFSAIIPHQLNWLLRCAPHVHRSGYLVWLRDPDALVFYPANILAKLNPRESLSVDDGIPLGKLHRADLTNLFYDLSPRPIDSVPPHTDKI